MRQHKNISFPTFFRRLVRPLLGLLLLCSAGLAMSADLGQAKSQGLIGERLDGYLQLMNPGAPQDVKQLVESVNAQRRAAYADIAKRNNTTPDKVGALTAPKAIAASPAGTPYQTGSGWKRK